MAGMQALKARVENGRYVIDERPDAPEGAVVYLMPVDDGDGLDDESREALHASLVASEVDIAAGRTVPAAQLIERLRAGL
jgi:hypothetical protein